MKNLINNCMRLSLRNAALIVILMMILGSDLTYSQWEGGTQSTDNIYRSGKVGIGTNAVPTSSSPAFEVNGNIKIMKLEGTTAGNTLIMNSFNTLQIGTDNYLQINPGGGHLGIKVNAGSPKKFDVNGLFRVYPAETGKPARVGIGDLDPGANFVFAVDGKIGAREVIVTTENPWPDFVFDKNYNLLPLEEVEQFIKTNKHLPEIPHAKEVHENGINVGEMQGKLLQKIEELTLYVIEENKKLEEQELMLRELEGK